MPPSGEKVLLASYFFKKRAHRLFARGPRSYTSRPLTSPIHCARLSRDDRHLGSNRHLGEVAMARDPHGQVQLHARRHRNHGRCDECASTHTGKPAQSSRFFKVSRRISSPSTLASFWACQALSDPAAPADPNACLLPYG